MTIAWLFELDPSYGKRHGAILRYENLSRHLRAAGHRVFYLVNENQSHQLELRNQMLEKLRGEGCCDDFFSLEGPPPVVKTGWRRHWQFSCRAMDRRMGVARQDYVRAFERITEQIRPDICIVSNRRSLFLIPQFNTRFPMIADWCDSFVLTTVRELGFLRLSKQYSMLPYLCKTLLEAMAEERYYGRHAQANVVVSPVDKQYLDRVNGLPERNHVLRNGVTVQGRPNAQKTGEPMHRLIFTGSMQFPPNARSALWFIDQVMPGLLKQRGDICFVAAGQEPEPELVARAGTHVQVTGLVPDIGEEIARSQLYVAPIFSGAGFRNKIVEALMAGTYVIGTPMALECFEPELQDLLLKASTPEEFIEKILMFLERPEEFEERKQAAIRMIEEKYDWSVRSGELERLCKDLIAPGGLAGRRPENDRAGGRTNL